MHQAYGGSLQVDVGECLENLLEGSCLMHKNGCKFGGVETHDTASVEGHRNLRKYVPVQNVTLLH